MIQYLWAYTRNGNPYVRLRNATGEEVSIMCFKVQREHKRKLYDHVFFRVFTNHRQTLCRGGQQKTDFANLNQAWCYARRMLGYEHLASC